MTNEGYQPRAPKSEPIPPRGESDTIRLSAKNIIGGRGHSKPVPPENQKVSVTVGGCERSAPPPSPPPRLYNGAGGRVDSKAQASSGGDALALCISIVSFFCIGFALGVAFSG